MREFRLFKGYRGGARASWQPLVRLLTVSLTSVVAGAVAWVTKILLVSAATAAEEFCNTETEQLESR